MMNDDECRAVGGTSSRGNRSTRRKPAFHVTKTGLEPGPPRWEVDEQTHVRYGMGSGTNFDTKIAMQRATETLGL
jgi:hypothetical protein